MMKQVFAHSYDGSGHAAITVHDDDEEVHIDAMRRRGGKVVHVGKYSITIEELRKALDAVK